MLSSHRWETEAPESQAGLPDSTARAGLGYFGVVELWGFSSLGPLCTLCTTQRVCEGKLGTSETAEKARGRSEEPPRHGGGRCPEAPHFSGCSGRGSHTWTLPMRRGRVSLVPHLQFQEQEHWLCSGERYPGLIHTFLLSKCQRGLNNEGKTRKISGENELVN